MPFLGDFNDVVLNSNISILRDFYLNALSFICGKESVFDVLYAEDGDTQVSF